MEFTNSKLSLQMWRASMKLMVLNKKKSISFRMIVMMMKSLLLRKILTKNQSNNLNNRVMKKMKIIMSTI